MNGLDDNKKVANKFNILLGYNQLFLWLPEKIIQLLSYKMNMFRKSIYKKNLNRYKCNCVAQYYFLFINNPICFSTTVITIIIYLLALFNPSTL